MTTTVTTSSISAVASGVTPIPFTFQALSAAEIGVSRNGVEVTTGFTVILNGDNTGSVTPTSTWGTDAVTIFSKPDYTQATNFLRTGPFYPDQMNPPLDRLARAIIALKGSTAAVPPYLPRASRIMGWDAAGLPTTYAQSAFKGAIGATGSQYISGTVAPTNGTGVDNDFYFNTVSKLIYGPKAAGAWPAGTSLGGTPGNDGTNGTNGGIGSSAGNAALFTGAAGMVIGAGITSFRTAGYSVAGKGGGEYIYDAAVNAAFVTANPRASFLAADTRGFRLAARRFVNVEQFGAAADFITDDTAAFTAAEFYAATYGAIVLLQSRKYYLASGYNAHRGVTWLGNGGQSALNANGDGATIIRVGKNVNGWVWNKGNTHGDGLGSQGDTSGGTMIGVAIYGGGITVDGSGNITNFAAGDSTTGHGVRIRSTFIEVNDVLTAFFGGDGFNINCSAGSGGASEGNANNFILRRCQSIYNRGFGFLTNGTDVNAGLVDNCSAISCGSGGIVEYSFLGNTYNVCHVRDCGMQDPTVSGGPTGTCVYAGVHYYAVAGQYVAASTTTPGTNTAVWRPWGGNATDRTWVSGMTWTIGSPYATNPSNSNARNVFTGCYAESAQPPCQAFAPTIFIGGLLEEVGFSPGSTSLWLRGSISSLAIPGIIALGNGSLSARVPFPIDALNTAWNVTTPGIASGAVDLKWSGVNDEGSALTFGGGAGGTNIASGIYTKTSNAYGSRMYLGTTNDFSAGAKTAVAIDENGNISFPRGTLTLAATKTITVGANTIYDASGNILGAGAITSRSPTSGVGYAVGAGGAVTQATSKATGVTLNKVTGQITLNNASLAASSAVSFVMTNSNIAATDVMRVNVASGAATPGSYLVQAEGFGAGTVNISVRNLTAGALAEALVLNFVIIKGVAA